MAHPSLADQLEFDALPQATKELAIRVLVHQHYRSAELIERVRGQQSIGMGERTRSSPAEFMD